MSQNPAFHPLSDMEDDILAVGRWAGVLRHLGTAATHLDSAEIWVVSNALHEVGKRLDARWNEAFDAAAGRAGR